MKLGILRGFSSVLHDHDAQFTANPHAEPRTESKPPSKRHRHHPNSNYSSYTTQPNSDLSERRNTRTSLRYLSVKNRTAWTRPPSVVALIYNQSPSSTAGERKKGLPADFLPLLAFALVPIPTDTRIWTDSSSPRQTEIPIQSCLRRWLSDSTLSLLDFREKAAEGSVAGESHNNNQYSEVSEISRSGSWSRSPSPEPVAFVDESYLTWTRLRTRAETRLTLTDISFIPPPPICPRHTPRFRALNSSPVPIKAPFRDHHDGRTNVSIQSEPDRAEWACSTRAEPRGPFFPTQPPIRANLPHSKPD